MDLVSVIIPVYNVQKYVTQAIQSILDQTYKNLEIIVIDDCSTDSTYERVLCLQEKDNRLKVYKNEKNIKIAATLNKGISLSNGQFIARMDGDDISKLDRIEKKVKFLKKNRHISLVGCSLIKIDEEGEILGYSRYLSDFKKMKELIKYSNPVPHIWVARREVYTNLNGYRMVSGCEDYDFLLRMISQGYKFSNISDYYGYYMRIGRIGNTSNSMGLKQIKLREYIYRLYLERISSGISKDSFNNIDYEKSIQVKKLESLLYSKSMSMLTNSIIYKSQKKYLKSILYGMLSACMSKYTLKYILGRAKNRVVKRQVR